jgi:hypothetical protein
MLFLQYDLPFVIFLIVRCMIFNIINVNDVFATLPSFTGSTIILYNWMIFCTKTISRPFLVNKGCMAVLLTIRILISRLRFFEISRIVRDFINKKFTPERPLMHFFIIE